MLEGLHTHSENQVYPQKWNKQSHIVVVMEQYWQTPSVSKAANTAPSRLAGCASAWENHESLDVWWNENVQSHRDKELRITVDTCFVFQKHEDSPNDSLPLLLASSLYRRCARHWQKTSAPWTYELKKINNVFNLQLEGDWINETFMCLWFQVSSVCFALSAAHLSFSGICQSLSSAENRTLFILSGFETYSDFVLIIQVALCGKLYIFL